MSSPRSGDAILRVCPDFVPSDALYLLDEWKPRKLFVSEQPQNGRNTISPSKTVQSLATAPPTTAASSYSHRSIKKSKNTRPASFYDKHLAPHLILKHVKYLGSLVAAIAGTVDKAIEDAYTKAQEKSSLKSTGHPSHEALQKLPRNMKGDLLPKTVVQRRGKDVPRGVLREDGVAEYYFRTTEYLLPIASTLRLHPFFPEWTSIILRWTKEANHAGWAIADGALQLTDLHSQDTDDDKEEFHLVEEHIDPKVKLLLDDVRKMYGNLATWEMKSLTVGDKEVFAAIWEMGVAGGFEWKPCRGNCGKPEEHAANMLASPTQHPRGSDALHPPWTLPVNDDFPPLRRHSDRLAHDIAGPSSTNGPPQLDSDSPLTLLGSASGENLDISVGKKRKRKNEASAKNQKKRRVVNDSDLYEPIGGERREVNAQSFLQQVSHAVCAPGFD